MSQAERFEINHFLETEERVPRLLTKVPRSTYIPLSTTSSWYDYYTRVSDKDMITGLISPDLKPLMENIEMANALRAATDELSMMLTIIAALEALYDDLVTKESLNLHLLGATARELDSLMCFEEILHLLPWLQSLHCSFVGIDMPNPIDGTNTIILDCCPHCTGELFWKHQFPFRGLFHDLGR
jgi:splicing suppressor protein 51